MAARETECKLFCQRIDHIIIKSQVSVLTVYRLRGVLTIFALKTLTNIQNAMTYEIESNSNLWPRSGR